MERRESRRRRVVPYTSWELEVRLDAESTASGVSKAELIRRGISLLLDSSARPRRSNPLPVFDSRRPLRPDEMDQTIYDRIKERAARR